MVTDSDCAAVGAQKGLAICDVGCSGGIVVKHLPDDGLACDCQFTSGVPDGCGYISGRIFGEGVIDGHRASLYLKSETCGNKKSAAVESDDLTGENYKVLIVAFVFENKGEIWCWESM